MTFTCSADAFCQTRPVLFIQTLLYHFFKLWIPFVLQHPCKGSSLYKKYKAQAHDHTIQKSQITSFRRSTRISERCESVGFF